MQHPLQYPEREFGETHLLTFKPLPTEPWCICILAQQLENVTNWFHMALNHCGLHCLYKTISTHLYHPRLCIVAERVTKMCNACQRQKIVGPQYGKLPAQNAALVPWEEGAIDLIGPWTVKLPNETFEFMVLTCIDPVTNLADAV